MEESFCALTHWHQVTVDYKGGLVHAASTNGPHLKFFITLILASKFSQDKCYTNLLWVLIGLLTDTIQ